MTTKKEKSNQITINRWRAWLQSDRFERVLWSSQNDQCIWLTSTIQSSNMHFSFVYRMNNCIQFIFNILRLATTFYFRFDWVILIYMHVVSRYSMTNWLLVRRPIGIPKRKKNANRLMHTFGNIKITDIASYANKWHQSTVHLSVSCISLWEKHQPRDQTVIKRLIYAWFYRMHFEIGFSNYFITSVRSKRLFFSLKTW